MPSYWVVGATVSGQNMADDFLRKGIWFANREDVQDRIEAIQKGDRLAIKSLLGQGATQVHIKALGIVTDIRSFAATSFKFFYVDWLDISRENRRVPFHGFGATLHTLQQDSEIARLVFHL